jgi:hypothetical protein
VNEYGPQVKGRVKQPSEESLFVWQLIASCPAKISKAGTKTIGLNSYVTGKISIV